MEEIFFPPEVVDVIQKQINNELYSSYLYKALGAFCDSLNLPGFAHWHFKQAEEETSHADKFMSYLTDSDVPVVLEMIQRPSISPMALTDAFETFQAALDHEKKVTEMLRNIASIALDKRDFRTFAFMDWFLNEQTEEMNTLQEIMARYQLQGGEALLEKELGQR